MVLELEVAAGCRADHRPMAAAHVLTVTEGGTVGVVDRALRKKGKRRYVGVRVRDFTTALTIVGDSDLIATVPERLATRLQQSLNLAIREVRSRCRPSAST